MDKVGDESILRRREGVVEVLTVHRPEALNALNRDVLLRLDRYLDVLSADSELRGIVITGSGKAFVAGADIAQMRSYAAVEAERFAAEGQEILGRLARMPVPVVAAVNGFALGGGCELAMACDLILAGPKARFGQPEVKLGVIPGFGGTQRLARRVGVGRALDLCLSGRMIDADEALRIGLADRKVDGDVVDHAVGLVREMAANGPNAMRFVKRAIHENYDQPLESALAAERSLFGLCFATSDQTEGMTAFLEKRPARFTGN